jgi:hypothetical protein
VLLTRSPLDLHQCYHRMDLARLACVRHAASVRPEPGSNSPSRSSGLCRPPPRSVCQQPIQIGEPVGSGSSLTDIYLIRPPRGKDKELHDTTMQQPSTSCPRALPGGWPLRVVARTGSSSLPFSRSTRPSGEPSSAGGGKTAHALWGEPHSLLSRDLPTYSGRFPHRKSGLDFAPVAVSPLRAGGQL